MSTRFRPADLDTSSDGGSKFLGYVPCGITGYEDRSDQFDWADVYIVISLSLEGSQYPQEMRLRALLIENLTVISKLAQY